MANVRRRSAQSNCAPAFLASSAGLVLFPARFILVYSFPELGAASTVSALTDGQAQLELLLELELG
jgi:hypothetical protein